MTHEMITEKPSAENILALTNSEVASFVTRCVRERSLSGLVSELNVALLTGTPKEQGVARKALQNIGFI